MAISNKGLRYGFMENNEFNKIDGSGEQSSLPETNDMQSRETAQEISVTDNAGEDTHNESEAADSSVTADNSGEYTYEWNDGTPEIKQSTQSQPTAAKAPKKHRHGLQIFAAVMTTICVFSLMALSYLLVGLYRDRANESGSDSNTVNTSIGSDVEKIVSVTESTGSELTLREIYKKLENSCVSILSNYSSGSGYFKETGTLLGSGFIITSDGYIVTNHHVIKDTTGLKVIMYDGTEYEAKLIASNSASDLAVIKIEGTFTPVELGDSSALEVGDYVCAIGTPSDLEFAGTMTYGIVSAINRSVSITNSFGTVIKTMTLIQTDATLNPGNSGGPLINMHGQVVGINTLKLSDKYEGVGFSIPMSGAIYIINSLIAGEDPDISAVTTSAAYLGITAETITESISSHYGVPQGVLILQIESSGSAYKAGLRRGDIIVAFDNTNVTSSGDLTTLLATKKAGDKVTVKVYRDSDSAEYLEFTFTLDARTE